MPVLFKRHNVKSNNEILLSYEGELSFELVHDSISDVENNISNSNFSLRSCRKIYNVLVEVLQNLAHNVSFEDADFNVDSKFLRATFKVWVEGDKCFVATGNYILTKNVQTLDDWLTEINGLDKAGVKEKNLQRDCRNFSKHG